MVMRSINDSPQKNACNGVIRKHYFDKGALHNGHSKLQRHRECKLSLWQCPCVYELTVKYPADVTWLMWVSLRNY